MPLVPIENLGQIGIIQDTPPYNLPPNAWSDGNNVRLLDNGVKKVAGYQEVMATCPFAPYYIHPYLTVEGTYYWLAYGATDIAVWNGSSWTDVVRQTTLQLNGAVSASASSITVDTGAALTALPTRVRWKSALILLQMQAPTNMKSLHIQRGIRVRE